MGGGVWFVRLFLCEFVLWCTGARTVEVGM